MKWLCSNCKKRVEFRYTENACFNKIIKEAAFVRYFCGCSEWIAKKGEEPVHFYWHDLLNNPELTVQEIERLRCHRKTPDLTIIK